MAASKRHREGTRPKARPAAPGARQSDQPGGRARATARAEEVLQDRASAAAWLRTPNRALGGMVPLDLLRTQAGLEAVLRVLGRIEAGVYS